MIRCNLVEGDPSSANGVTLEGMPQDRIHGKPMAFLGAKVYCPACKTSGQIVGTGEGDSGGQLTGGRIDLWNGSRREPIGSVNLCDAD